MKQKIQKLCKMLNRFSLNDLVSMSEISENEILPIIEQLLEENVIKQTGEEYIYIPTLNKIQMPVLISKEESKKYKTKETVFKKSVLFNVSAHFPNKKEEAIYLNAPDWAKSYLIKYTTLLRACGNLRGDDLKKFIERFNSEHPDYKTSYSSFIRKRKLYARNGLKGLIPAYKNDSKSTVAPEMYEEFKNLYLNQNNYSVRKCLDIIAHKHNYDTMPTGGCFMRVLRKEFSDEAIERFRMIPMELPTLTPNNPVVKKEIQTNKITKEKFIDGAELYLKALKNKKTETDICRIGYVKNHLIPFFKNYKFRDITQDTINNYINSYLAQGYSMGSINRFLASLSIIINTFADINNTIIYTTNNAIPVTDVLTPKEIEEILKNNTPDLWYLTLGIKPSELAALNYEDIDYKAGTVKINKVMQQGSIQRYRTMYQQRELKIPRVLLHKISKNNGAIFYNINSNNYEKILNTHIKLLLDKNVQINIIAENLGFRTTSEFENRYKFLLPQKLEDNFEIL